MITPVKFNNAQSFNGKILIPAKDMNKNVKYLYNQVNLITKTNHLTSTFKTDNIEILTYCRKQTEEIVNTLKKIGITFTSHD